MPRLSLVLIFALLNGAATAAGAGTQSGSLTVSGPLPDAPPPASCAYLSMPVSDASYAIPPEGIMSFEKSGNMVINCTSGLSVNVHALNGALVPLMRGTIPSNIGVVVAGGTDGRDLKVGIAGQIDFVGTGSHQSFRLRITFQSLSAARIMPGDTYDLSGAAPLTFAY